MTLPTDWAFDCVGYQDMSGLEFCVRCAPGTLRSEAYELLRLEAEGECAQCGTELSGTTHILSRTQR